VGILDVFKKKKDDFADASFADSPAGIANDPFQTSFQEQGQPLATPPQQGFQQYPGFPSPGESQPQQQGFSPEAAGFERVPAGQSSFHDSRQQAITDVNIGKDFELVNAKLDAIKAELDSVNQRLKRIERIAEEPGAHKDAWQY
jgi:hypothetical protein